ncbi:MAG: hypothetical protein ACUVXA_14315 [Candidatus Jordarchaeum sp.]|uniref:hypothetical protein n=1 Tax=Candidatus Jordarchaeum sp. TaxID=2823881 RepID=UPI004049CB5A
MVALCRTPNICYFSNSLIDLSGKDEDFRICYRGEYTIITVRMQNSTDPIIGELTLFHDELNSLLIGGAYTNSSGYAVLNWSIRDDYNLGLTTIKATCPNRPDTVPVYTDLLIKAGTFFENLTYPPEAFPGEYLTVEADLRDNINNSISDQQVHLIDQQNISLTESPTDVQGHCILSWLIPYDFIPGLYSFRIVFEGNPIYASTKEEFNVTILPPKGTTFENLTHTISAYPGEYLVVEAYLKDVNNSSLTDQLLYLYDSLNISLAVSATDSLGHCVVSWLIPSGFTPGVYGFWLRFEGDQIYG